MSYRHKFARSRTPYDTLMVVGLGCTVVGSIAAGMFLLHPDGTSQATDTTAAPICVELMPDVWMLTGPTPLPCGPSLDNLDQFPTAPVDENGCTPAASSVNCDPPVVVAAGCASCGTPETTEPTETTTWPTTSPSTSPTTTSPATDAPSTTATPPTSLSPSTTTNATSEPPASSTSSTASPTSSPPSSTSTSGPATSSPTSSNGDSSVPPPTPTAELAYSGTDAATLALYAAALFVLGLAGVVGAARRGGAL